MHKRLEPFKKYAELVINTIFEKLVEYFHKDLRKSIDTERTLFPILIKNFEEWLVKYSNYNIGARQNLKLKNKIIYDIQNEKLYKKSVIDFISGMSDNFAIQIFNEIISF